MLSSVFCITLFALFAAFSLSKYAEVKSKADDLVQSVQQVTKPKNLPLNSLNQEQFHKYLIEENGQFFLKIPLPEHLQANLQNKESML